LCDVDQGRYCWNVSPPPPLDALKNIINKGPYSEIDDHNDRACVDSSVREYHQCHLRNREILELLRRSLYGEKGPTLFRRGSPTEEPPRNDVMTAFLDLHNRNRPRFTWKSWSQVENTIARWVSEEEYALRVLSHYVGVEFESMTNFPRFVEDIEEEGEASDPL